MKLNPISIYGSIYPENCPVDIYYWYAKAMAKSESQCKNATFRHIIEWSYDLPVLPAKINNWSEEELSKFARFINPENLTWTKRQLVNHWNFINEILTSNICYKNTLDFGFPTPRNIKTLSPLLVYSICSRMKPSINMRGRTVKELYPVARATLFPDRIDGLIETLKQTLSLALLTTTEVDPLLLIMKSLDEATKILTKTFQGRMNTGDRFSFIRGHIDANIAERAEMGFYQIFPHNLIHNIQDVQEESDDEVNPISFYQYGGDEDEETDPFQNTTTLPMFFMSLIGKNLNDFEFGDTYAICLKNKQVMPDFELGREDVCAVIRAALYHNKDITDAEEPSLVTDDDMDEYPSLNDDFNPMIPPKAYPLYVLKELAYNEGIIESVEAQYDEYELHEMLQLNLVKPRFWHGLCTPTINEYTILLEDIHDIKEPISYGVRGGPYYIFDPEELADYFKSNGTLQNPASQKVDYFTPTSIRQLLRMLNPFSSSSSYNIRGEGGEEGEGENVLVDAVNEVIRKLGSMEMKIQEFYNLYKNSNDERKNEIVKIVYALHSAGMYMRGWSGSGELPIVNTSSDDYNKVEENSNMAIGNFLSLMEKADEKIRDCINEIPLWKYRKGLFLRRAHEADTVEKGIDLVLKGEQTNNENSCIRVSSNYFCGTSYRLAKIINLDLGYKIEDIREIA